MDSLKQCCRAHESKIGQNPSPEQMGRVLIAQGNYQIALLERVVELLDRPQAAEASKAQQIAQPAIQSEPKGFIRRLFG